MSSIAKRTRSSFALALTVGALLCAPAEAFRCPSSPCSSSASRRRAAHSPLRARSVEEGDRPVADRRAFVRKIVAGASAGSAALLLPAVTSPLPALALVEGNPAPTKTKALGEEYRQGTAALGDSVEAEVLPREAYKKLDSGVVYADISVGTGDTVVKEGSKVNMQWVLRKSNGYFVDSSAVSDSVPFIFTVGDPNGAIVGLDEGVRGMRAGGTRRVLIPPRLAWANGLDDGKPGPIPVGFGPRQQMRRVMEARRDVPGEYIFLEVKVSRLR